VSTLANLRNVAIIVGIAAIVALAPGGGTTAQVVITAVSLIFLAALAWVASIQYREHRTTLYSLGDSRRAALYAAAAVLAVTLTATSKLWNSSAGSVAWLLLVGGSVYTLFAVVWAARRY
jgi:multisubunit Na+/H+ antiporter MnhB subunit